MKKNRKQRKIFGINIQGHFEAIKTGVEHIFLPRMTLHYPEVLQDFGPNYRGMLKLHMDLCISCTQCARICPSNAIKMYKTDAKRYPGLTYQRCIFCGFCVAICPVDALKMFQIHDTASYDVDEQNLKPDQFGKGPPVEVNVKKVKPRFDEKRGLKYERL